jgi:hypothetical protein
MDHPIEAKYMGIADRIYDLVKALPESQASKILQFAESVSGQSVTIVPAERPINLAVFRQYRGCYDGKKIDRAVLYDRAGLR